MPLFLLKQAHIKVTLSHRFRSPLLKPPKRRGGRSPRCLPMFTGKNHGCSVFLEGDMLICCHKTTYDNICTHQRKNTQAYSYYTILHIYIYKTVSSSRLPQQTFQYTNCSSIMFRLVNAALIVGCLLYPSVLHLGSRL